jgi:uncharacterized membrane protein YkgB
MNAALFLTALLAVSLFTGLFTEAFKKLLDEAGKTYHSNALAGIVSVVLALLVCAGYVIVSGTAINAVFAVYVVALTLLSWLAAMVGYDKVIQAIAQIKGE